MATSLHLIASGFARPVDRRRGCRRTAGISILGVAVGAVAYKAFDLFQAAPLFIGFPDVAVACRNVRDVVAVRMLAKGGAEEEEDELEVWKAAYELEVDRAELISQQLETELERLGAAGEELAAEYEGCKADLYLAAPDKPTSSAADEWANAYSAIRKCNEQAELKLNEVRGKLQEKGMEEKASKTPDVNMDFGPIRYKGIKFKGVSFPRYAKETGSTVYFLELGMPMGLRLEDTSLGSARGLIVTEVGDGGSAADDGRVRVGDIVRAITVPQRRLKPSGSGQEEESGNLGDALGVGAGEQTKAMLVIPSDTRAFPFDRILEDLQKNQAVDSLVGLVMERPLQER